MLPIEREFADADDSGSELSTRVLDAARTCVCRWGMGKTTIDDVVEASGVSRATIYRLFPGGRDVMFDALRVREINLTLDRIVERVQEATNLDDAIARGVAAATHDLRTDACVAAMMEFDPESLVDQLAADGLPRILLIAGAALGPTVEGHAPTDKVDQILDLVTRLTISYFLAPDPTLDLADVEQARAFFSPLVQAVLATEDASTMPARGGGT